MKLTSSGISLKDSCRFDLPELIGTMLFLLIATVFHCPSLNLPQLTVSFPYHTLLSFAWKLSVC